jgi:hypothetical protein
LALQIFHGSSFLSFLPHRREMEAQFPAAPSRRVSSRDLDDVFALGETAGGQLRRVASLRMYPSIPPASRAAIQPRPAGGARIPACERAQRWIRGQPWGAEALWGELEQARRGVARGLALDLAARTRGQVQLAWDAASAAGLLSARSYCEAPAH